MWSTIRILYKENFCGKICQKYATETGSGPLFNAGK